MRLTLRTLLAYLDDMLDPARTKEIGRKIADDPAAQEMIEQIRKVTRRRHLTTPDESARAGGDSDANTIAEYLDNTLPAEQAAEIDKACLKSDVYLAEVAACHQILTLILGEPAEVPPLAYQRMYGLVKGREAIPLRKAPAAAMATPAAGVAAEEADEAVLGLPFYRLRGSWARRAAPAAAVLLLGLGLFAVLYQAMSVRDRAVPQDFAVAPPDKPLPPPIDQAREKVLPAAVSASELAFQSGNVSSLTSMVAARPVLPANLFLAIGVGVAEEPLPPEPEPAEPAPQEPPVVPVVPPASRVKQAVGMHTSPTTKESLLLRRATVDEANAANDSWLVVRPQARVQTGELLTVLPGFRSEITLDSKVRIDLVGHLEEASSSHVLETAAELHRSADVDADVTLRRGRLVLANLRADGPVRIRLRFYGQVWEVQLTEAASLAGIELIGRVVRNSPLPHAKLSLTTAGAPIRVSRGDAGEEVPPGKLILWDNLAPPTLVNVQFPVAAPPPWMFKVQRLLDETLLAQVAFEKQLLDKIGNLPGDKESALIPIAFEESLSSSRALERRLALFSLGAIDQLPIVISALDDQGRPDVRSAALATLWHWLGRSPEQVRLLRGSLRDAGYSDMEIEAVATMMQGFDRAGDDAYAFLIEKLGHDRLAIRELAISNLRELTPVGQRIAFDPAGTPEQRARAIESWKARFLPKGR